MRDENKKIDPIESTAIVNLRDFDRVPNELSKFLLDNEKQDINRLKQEM